MDPLTILGAVTGGISAASETLKVLEKAISLASKVKDAPELAISTLRDVRMMRANMQRFQKLLDSDTFSRDRGCYIGLEDAQNTFTDCVASLDELESLLKPLSEPGLLGWAMSRRLDWAMKDKKINKLSARVRDAQSSLGLMLNILQSESLVEVNKAMVALTEICQRIAPNVAHLNRRSIISHTSSNHNDDEADDSATIRPSIILRPDSLVLQTVPEEGQDGLQEGSLPQLTTSHFRFAFEEDLQASPAYRRAPKWAREDVSFRSSILNPHALSLLSRLSELSLGTVSAISVVALPICCKDMSNPQHYTFGEVISDDGHDGDGGMTPLNSPSSREAFEDREPPPGPEDGISEHLIIHNIVPSLDQLSHSSLEEIEWQLCHEIGRAPCHGAVESRYDEYSEDMIWRSQLDLAAKRGYLDDFKCRECNMTLTDIASQKRPKPMSLELWCGSPTCRYRHPYLRPCPCYTRMKNQGLPTTRYLACRKVPSQNLECARCFRICPNCKERDFYATLELPALPSTNKKDGSGPPKTAFSLSAKAAISSYLKTVLSIPLETRSLSAVVALRYWDTETDIGRLFFAQALLIRTQKYILDNIEVIPSERRVSFNQQIAEIDKRLEPFKNPGHGSTGHEQVLLERQQILKTWQSLAPLWYMTKSRFLDDAFDMLAKQMRKRVREGEDAFARLAKTNPIFGRGPAKFEPNMETAVNIILHSNEPDECMTGWPLPDHGPSSDYPIIL